MSHQIIEKFKSIKPWTKGGRRAPHKPLLILHALGKYQSGVRKLFWNDLEAPLKQLFYDYGVSGLAKPEYPFIRLSNDGIWERSEVDLNASGDAKISDLRRNNAFGKFSDDILLAFDSNPALVDHLINQILNDHFPDSLHKNIEDVTRLKRNRIISSWVRDPRFRQNVLYAYKGQCAVCGYNIGTRQEVVGLEAAHIRWVQHKGPDTINNGVALCSNHHALFDNGLWCLTHELKFQTSPRAQGNERMEHYLARFEGKHVFLPKGNNRPNSEFIEWQRKEVFKS